MASRVGAFGLLIGAALGALLMRKVFVMKQLVARRLLGFRPLLLLLLTAMLIGATAYTAGAQVQSPRLPGKALSLSLLMPGAGQAYNGQWAKGRWMLGGELLSSAVVIKYGDGCELFDIDRNCDRFNVGLVGMVGFWVWSMIDAPITAIAINHRMDAGRVALEIGPRLTAPTGDSRVGLSLVRLRF